MTKERYDITVSHAVQPFEHAKGKVFEIEIELDDSGLETLIALLKVMASISNAYYRKQKDVIK